MCRELAEIQKLEIGVTHHLKFGCHMLTRRNIENLRVILAKENRVKSAKITIVPPIINTWLIENGVNIENDTKRQRISGN